MLRNRSMRFSISANATVAWRRVLSVSSIDGNFSIGMFSGVWAHSAWWFHESNARYWRESRAAFSWRGTARAGIRHDRYCVGRSVALGAGTPLAILETFAPGWRATLSIPVEPLYQPRSGWVHDSFAALSAAGALNWPLSPPIHEIMMLLLWHNAPLGAIPPSTHVSVSIRPTTIAIFTAYLSTSTITYRREFGCNLLFVSMNSWHKSSVKEGDMSRYA